MQVLDDGNKSIGRIVVFSNPTWPVLYTKEQSPHLGDF